MSVKLVLPKTVSFTIDTIELKKWIDDKISLSTETGNWSIAYNLCNHLPGLQNAHKLAEYVLDTIRQVKKSDEGETIYAENGNTVYSEITTEDIIRAISKIYNMINATLD